MRSIVVTGIGSAGDLEPLAAVAGALEDAGWSIASHFFVLHKRGSQDSLAMREALSIPGDEFMPAKFLDTCVVPYVQDDAAQIMALAKDKKAEAIVGNQFCWAGNLAARTLGLPYISCVVSPGFLRYGLTVENDEMLIRLVDGSRQALLADADLELLLFDRAWANTLDQRDANFIGPCWPSAYLSGAVNEFRRWSIMQARICLITFGTWVAPAHKAAIAEMCTTVALEEGFSVLYLGDVAPDPRPGLFVAEYIPLHFVMARIQAAITHAGIGTLTQLLRCEIPMVCIPFCADQEFNARGLSELASIPRLSAQLVSLPALRAAFRLREKATSFLGQRNGAPLAAERIAAFLA